MKNFLPLICLVAFNLSGQTKRVTESVTVDKQEELNLEFAFADKIEFEVWNKNEVFVEVDVDIMDGKYNDIFSLRSTKSTYTISIEMDKDMWNKIDKAERKRNCNWYSELNYKVYLPKNMEITANTISGNYELKYYGTPLRLKTISGAIDVTVPESASLDFRAQTISGEVFSDIDIEFPYGKEGLRQIVGQKVRGRIKNGGEELEFETISGNIYLRKG